MPGGHHAVDGVAELVGQRRHVPQAPGVVDQHPGGETGQDGGAHRAAALALAHLAVHVVLGEDTAGELGEAGVEVPEGVQDQPDRLVVGDLPVRVAHRSVEIVAAQALHAEPSRLQPEVALEDVALLAADLEEGLHGFVRHVVRQVAHGQGRGHAPHLDVLRVPVPDAVDVDLAQDRGLLAVDPVELPVRGRPKVRIRGVGVAHQLVPGEGLRLSRHLQVELQPVGEHGVDRRQGVDPVRVLDVDELLAGFVQGVRGEAAELLEVVALIRVLVGRRQEPLRVGVRERAPPQPEEEDPVEQGRQQLVDPAAQRECLARLGVRRERQGRVPGEDPRRLHDRLVVPEYLQKPAGLHVRPQRSTVRLEPFHRPLQNREALGEGSLARVREELAQVPARGPVLGGGRGVGQGHG